MKKHVKWTLFILMSMAIAQFSMMASFAQDTQGMRSEANTLENIYQEKATLFLNKLMNPDDYTLVITASIRNDEQKLKEYHDAIDKKYLPGLIMKDPLSFSDAHNLLLDMKQKAEIQVILSDNVPPDRDNLVREVLKTNLRLNEESGDTITVVRATRTVASVDPVPNPNKLPELSGRMIIFWIIVALLTLAGVAFWLIHRREQKKKEEEKEAEAKAAETIPTIEANEDSTEEEEEEVEEAREKTPDEIEAERDALEMKLAFAKGELVKLIGEYPNIVTRAAEEFAAQGKIQDTVTFMEALGWDHSKRLFKELEGRMWTRIGVALRERERDPTAEETYHSVHIFHRFALSFVLERAGRDTENPFTFIFQLTDSQRIDLLTHEKAENIALIAIYCSGPQMGELLKGLPEEKQNQVLLNITKIRQLPEVEIKEGVDAFLMRLERIKADPSVYVDGPTLAADFMRSLPPAREEELYLNLQNTHPEEAEKIRRVRVIFQDIPYYPQEMVRRVIESYESEDIMKALVGYDGQFVETFLGLLPVKKALMIQNDLYHMNEFPPASQCAEYRRKIAFKLEQEFELQRFNVTEFWKQNTQTEAVAQALESEEAEITAVMDNQEPQAVFEDEPEVTPDEGEGGENAA